MSTIPRGEGWAAHKSLPLPVRGIAVFFFFTLRTLRNVLAISDLCNRKAEQGVGGSMLTHFDGNKR
jgi:hypothetical protein